MVSEVSSHDLIIVTLVSFFAAAGAPWIVRFLKDRAVGALAVFPALMTGYFLTQLPSVIGGRALHQSLIWLTEPRLFFSFSLDGLSLLFSLLISGIGTLIVVFSGSYLQGHPRLGRFYAFFFLFMGSMLGLVLSDNLIQTFVFWEMTSVSSYFLIGFESDRKESRDAALQALLVTGSGGLAMLAGFIVLFMICGTYEISELVKYRDQVQGSLLYVPALLLIAAGAFTKSAQFPFHFWLPGAMQAPAPVSAYLHSATMVKAGIYLLARLNPIFAGTAAWTILLTTAGTVTMVTGSFMALQKKDLKLILAYMTVMALGLLVLLLGIGTSAAILALMVYIVVHSLYKGGLFLVAGIIDHETGTRDLDRLSNLSRRMKWTAISAVLCTLSMAGIPLFLGFIGKEMIYESLWTTEPRSWIILVTTTISMMALVGVALLIGYKVFFRNKSSPSHPDAHEAPVGMISGPLILATLGVFFGSMPDKISGLVKSAAQSVLGQPIEIDLTLWHGFNPALGLSLISVFGGVVIYLLNAPIRDLFLRIDDRIVSLSPQRLYESGLILLRTFSTRQTEILQNGSLYGYLLWLLVFTICVLIAFGSHHWVDPRSLDWGNILYYEWVLGVLMVLGALSAARASAPLIAVTSLGILGYAIALTYVLYGAPDLAMTQFLVETLTVILLALVLSKLPGYSPIQHPPIRKAVTAVVSGVFGALMMILIWHTLEHPLDRSLSDYFSANSLALAHGRNIVNVILVDFRALDTLGEITVLGVAALGIFGLVRLKAEGKNVS
jgi:multicomponent Na+:H+ antiporter subunit A